MTGPVWALCACVLLLLVVGSIAGGAPPAPFAAPTAGEASRDACPDPEERTFLGLLNAYRAGRGLRPLVASAGLAATADQTSRRIAAAGTPGPDDGVAAAPPGPSIAAGPSGQAWGMNTAWGPDAAAAATVFDWWRHSPEHRHNLLGDEYRAVGFGRVEAAASPAAWYWTVVFASSPGIAPDC